MKFKKIIISRTDNLGDVVLTLPLAGILKSTYHHCEIYFIGKAYTRPIINSSIYIDAFLDREEILKSPEILKNIGADAIMHIFPDKEIARLAKKVEIPIRIGTSHRFFHWIYCNKLVSFSRKNSSLHETQLNLNLLKPLGIDAFFKLADIPQFYGMVKMEDLPEKFSQLIQKNKFNLILHPKSKGSAREWSLKNYFQLAEGLSSDQFQILITGTAEEGEKIKNEKPELFSLKHVTDLTGKLSLENLLSLIHQADGLVACSTGPLHIASALGKNVCGIYPPMRPIHPGRWAPIGEKAEVLVLKKSCNACEKSQTCSCINSIRPEDVKEKIQRWQVYKR